MYFAVQSIKDSIDEFTYENTNFIQHRFSPNSIRIALKCLQLNHNRFGRFHELSLEGNKFKFKFNANYNKNEQQ